MAQLAHFRIADVAEAMAADAYETLAKDNRFYKAWPNQKSFALKHRAAYMKAARTSLTTMLGKSYPNLSKEEEEKMKEEIMDVLLNDRFVPQGNVNIPTLAARSQLIH